MHSVPKSAVLPYASGVGGLSRRLLSIDIYVICMYMDMTHYQNNYLHRHKSRCNIYIIRKFTIVCQNMKIHMFEFLSKHVCTYGPAHIYIYIYIKTYICIYICIFTHLHTICLRGAFGWAVDRRLVDLPRVASIALIAALCV